MVVRSDFIRSQLSFKEVSTLQEAFDAEIKFEITQKKLNGEEQGSWSGKKMTSK